MKIIDPHIHLWDTRKLSFPWLAKPRMLQEWMRQHGLLPPPAPVDFHGPG